MTSPWGSPQRSLIGLAEVFPEGRLQHVEQPPQIFSTPTERFWYDFNGNGVLDPPYILQGDECLVFFLGGVPFQDPRPARSA